jgi:cell division cycle 14
MQIFVLNYSAERAYAPFIGCEPSLYPFRDAGFCINTFPITVLDCARGMRKAVAKGHFNFNDFDLATFQRLAKLQHGDISWIVPGKFIAFSGPVAKYVLISWRECV